MLSACDAVAPVRSSSSVSPDITARNPAEGLSLNAHVCAAGLKWGVAMMWPRKSNEVWGALPRRTIPVDDVTTGPRSLVQVAGLLNIFIISDKGCVLIASCGWENAWLLMAGFLNALGENRLVMRRV